MLVAVSVSAVIAVVAVVAVTTTVVVDADVLLLELRNCTKNRVLWIDLRSCLCCKRDGVRGNRRDNRRSLHSYCSRSYGQRILGGTIALSDR